MCFSVPSPTRSLVSADSTEKFYLLLLLLRSAILENTRILSGILNVYSKTKNKSCWEKKVFFRNNRKKLQNSVCHLETQSYCHQFLQDLIIKLSVLKCRFSQKKNQFSKMRKCRCSPYYRKFTNWNCSSINSVCNLKQRKFSRDQTFENERCASLETSVETTPNIKNRSSIIISRCGYNHQ